MASSSEQHAQVMGALDTLTKRLMRSELERQDLKETIINARHETEDVRTLLEKSEISRIRQQQGLLSMLEEALAEQEALKARLEENGSTSELDDVKASQERLKILIAKNQRAVKSLHLKQRDQESLGVKTDYVESQMKRLQEAVVEARDKADQADKLNNNIAAVQNAQTEMRKALEQSDVKQTRLAEEIKQTKQKQTQMNRRIESTVQRYQRLERKFRRVEQIALESQEALQAKAMVLLTDQSRIAIQGRDAENTPPAKVIEQDNVIAFFKSNMKTAAAIALALGITAGLGFGVTQMAFEHDAGVRVTAQDTVQDITVVSSQASQELEPVPTAHSSDLENMSEALITAKTSNDETIAPDPDLSEAAKKLEIASFAGNAEAQHDLAALYASGQGGADAPNYERAAYWFQKAAEKGVGNARYNLGVLYHQGLGVPQDIKIAVSWYQQAAQTGHPEAHYNLGIAYVEGIGMAFDAQAAAEHFEVAARENIPEAAYNLGLILENGLLGTPNIDQALYWYQRAADNGNAQAQEAFSQLKSVADKLADEQPYEAIEEPDAPIQPALEEQHSSNEITAPQKDDTTAAFAPPPAPAQLQGEEIDEEIIVYAGPDDQPWQPVDALDLNDSVVFEVQKYLAQVDLYKGEPDGMLDNKTQDAIMGYQALYELPVTGKASDDLLDHMRNFLALND